jgi:hypothetical protein
MTSVGDRQVVAGRWLARLRCGVQLGFGTLSPGASAGTGAGFEIKLLGDVLHPRFGSERPVATDRVADGQVLRFGHQRVDEVDPVRPARRRSKIEAGLGATGMETGSR